MENEQTQRLLYDRECKDCKHKTMCERADTAQQCRGITDQLRLELRKSRKVRKIVAKIIITTEYDYSNYKPLKTVAKKGMYVLREPYQFGETFLRSEISGTGNGGTFSTQYYRWDK
jgi:hypothetical protein